MPKTFFPPSYVDENTFSKRLKMESYKEVTLYAKISKVLMIVIEDE
jgi:hypothetical protein